MHPRIGPSYGRGHRQHAWYARTARLKSIMKDSRLVEKNIQNDLESVQVLMCSKWSCSKVVKVLSKVVQVVKVVKSALQVVQSGQSGQMCSQQY